MPASLIYICRNAEIVIMRAGAASLSRSEESTMLVSCDDFGMLFFRSLRQYRQFFRHLPAEERAKFHRHSRNHTHLGAIRTLSQTACPILLRVD